MSDSSEIVGWWFIVFCTFDFLDVSLPHFPLANSASSWNMEDQMYHPEYLPPAPSQMDCPLFISLWWNWWNPALPKLFCMVSTCRAPILKGQVYVFCQFSLVFSCDFWPSSIDCLFDPIQTVSLLAYIDIKRKSSRYPRIDCR